MSGTQGPAHTARRARAFRAARLEARDPALVALLELAREWPLPDGSRARLYRLRATAPPGVTSEAVLGRLARLDPAALGWAAREVSGLEVAAEPVDGREARAGRFRRLVLRVGSARVGDFRRRPAGVRVSDLEPVLERVRADPGRLGGRGRGDLDVERVRIRRARIEASALGARLTQLLPWGRRGEVAGADGRLRVEAAPLGATTRLVTRPAVEPGPALALRVDEAAIGPCGSPRAW